MSPTELRDSNIALFQRVLARTRDRAERIRIGHLITEERSKPDSAYPKADPAAFYRDRLCRLPAPAPGSGAPLPPPRASRERGRR